MTTEVSTAIYPNGLAIAGTEDLYLRINDVLVPGVISLNFNGAFASRQQDGLYGQICMSHCPKRLQFFTSLDKGKAHVELLRLDADTDSSTFRNQEVLAAYDVIFSPEYEINVTGGFPTLSIEFDILPSNETEEA